MSWLKSARGLAGISARELGERVGVSLNYIQRIEGGSRELPQELASRIYEALGFTPQEVRFDSQSLLQEIEQAIAAKGDAAWCLLEFKAVGQVLYFTSVSLAAQGDERRFVPTTLYAARLLVRQQARLFG